MFSIQNIHFQLAVKIVIGLISFFQPVHAQEEVDPFKFPATNTTSISCRDVSDKNNGVDLFFDDGYPEYPGGIIAMRSFLEENIIYPSDSVEGKIYVSLLIDTMGHVTKVNVKKSLSPLADAEVIRVMKLMVFKPALINGKPINSRISLPCSFSLGKKD
ncbi:energy transducer TonB [Fluviicola chungangensis]|uniref:TonB family protein n=1 Tax=Fluviicola chungangensis TaxID=2597671 RepID=A0A556N112_9FLAO|nr:energy transducer TonB [Fluviicola chungangensis]TSJ45728.1 TonB family protein [Fluviicola chungangensis]